MTIDAEAIRSAVATAPAWAKIGLTVPQERLRDDACLEVASHLYRTLYEPLRADTDQLALPL